MNQFPSPSVVHLNDDIRQMGIATHAHVIVRYTGRKGLKTSHGWQAALFKMKIPGFVYSTTERDGVTHHARSRKSLEMYVCSLDKGGRIDFFPNVSPGFTLAPETIKMQRRQMYILTILDYVSCN